MGEKERVHGGSEAAMVEEGVANNGVACVEVFVKVYEDLDNGKRAGGVKI